MFSHYKLMIASSWIARELQRGLQDGAARMGRLPVLLQLVFHNVLRSIDGHEGQPEQPHIRIFVSFRDCVFLVFSQGCKTLCVVHGSEYISLFQHHNIYPASRLQASHMHILCACVFTCNYCESTLCAWFKS